METYLPYNPNATQKKYESAQITNSLITLRHIPKEGSIVINNFTESSSANPAQGYFFCNYSADTFYRDANRTLIFNAADNNKTVSIEYIAVGTPFTAQDANEIKSHLENNSIHGAGGGMTFRGVFNDDTPADPADDDFSIINNQSYIYKNGYIPLPHYSPFRGYNSSSVSQSKFQHWKEQIPGDYESAQLVTEDLYWGEYFSEESAEVGTIHPPKYTNGLRLWDGYSLRSLEGGVPAYVKNVQSGDEPFDTGDIFPRYDDFYKLFIKLPAGQAKTQFRIDTPDDLEDQLQDITDRIAALENSSPSLQKKTKTLSLTEHLLDSYEDMTDWEFFSQGSDDVCYLAVPATCQNVELFNSAGVNLDPNNQAFIDSLFLRKLTDDALVQGWEVDSYGWDYVLQDLAASRTYSYDNPDWLLDTDLQDNAILLDYQTITRSDGSSFTLFFINAEVRRYFLQDDKIIVEYEEST